MENSKSNTLHISVNNVRGATCHISQLKLIGNYSLQSIDDKTEYFNNVSQLRYCKQPTDPQNVNFQLSKVKIEVESTITDTEKQNTVIDIERENTLANTEEETEETVQSYTYFLLKWVSENLDLIRAKGSNSTKRCLEPDIICTRGPIKTLLLTPFERYSGWILCASKFKGTIYLIFYQSDDRKEQVLNFTSEQKLNLIRGFEFEEYMLSDTPFGSDDVSATCDINGEFHCVFESKLNKKTLLYSAEIDGIRSQQVVEDTVVGKSVELIELKTTPSNICGRNGLRDPNRMLSWWAQCHLADIKTIICGCKEKSGEIKRIQEIKLYDFVYRIKDKQKRCLSFCNGFLDFIQSTVCKEYNESLYKFAFDLNKKEITAEELDPNCDYAFLEPWYIKKVEDHFPQGQSTSCT